MPAPHTPRTSPRVTSDTDAIAAPLLALEEDMKAGAGRLFVDLVAEYFAATREASGHVSTPRTADELLARFAEPLPAEGRPLEEVVRRLSAEVIADANQLMQPMSLGHQVAAPLPAAVWTEAVVSALNQSTAIWEMSPTATVIETQLVRQLAGLVGWGPESGGTFTSGGTEATFTALLAARARAMPHAWQDGVGAMPPVVLCGEHSHYSVTRAVAALGLGMRRAIAVASRDWKMDPIALEATLDHLAADETPVMAVVASAGTTATGSFDELSIIGPMCEERGIWLHVDGAHGASAILSPAHRHRLRGLHHARSVAWDAHKMMLMPLAAKNAPSATSAPQAGISSEMKASDSPNASKNTTGAAQCSLLRTNSTICWNVASISMKSMKFSLPGGTTGLRI